MDLRKIIKIFYLIYTIYIVMVINTTTLTFFMILPAIMLMWINYFLFSVGYNRNKGNKVSVLKSKHSNTWLLERNKLSLLVIASFSMLFSIVAVKYYTGQTPISTFNSLSNNISLYNEYQLYFREQQRNIFSITKIPFIFMLFYIKFFLFYSYMSFLIIKRKVTRFEKIYLGVITLSFLYVGVARGTNFEFFELLMLVIFLIFCRHRTNRKFQLPLKTLAKVFLLGSLMIFLLYYGISTRVVNFNFYTSQGVYYDPNGLLPFLSPFLSFVTMITYSYFGFGFFYISTYVSELWLSSIDNLVAGFLPFGYYIIRTNSIKVLMRDLIDMGAKWHPDFVLIINSIGYLGLLLFCFLLGVFTKYIYKMYNKDPITYLTSFIILLQMLAIPIGNFVFVSSASKLIVILLTIYWIWKLFIKVKMKLKN